MATTVIGLYDRLEDAQNAISELVSAGFQREDISMVAADTEGKFKTYVGAPGEDAGEGVATGAGVGAAIGGLGGLLVGIGALAIPGIGPVLAAGPIASALIGMGVGAVTGGLIGALVDAGVPEEQANLYAEGVRRGGTLVKVTSREDRSDEATRILNRFNPIDVEERATTWRSEKWSGFDPNATPYTQTDFERERSRFSTDMERQRDQERSRVHTYAMGRSADADMRADYNRYDPLFRTHYQTNYGSTGRSYEEFQPAYLYGYDLAGNPQYRNMTWEQVEIDARRSWEREHQDTLWDDIKDAVREGWMRVTGQL
jgi:hypothetical protein